VLSDDCDMHGVTESMLRGPAPGRAALTVTVGASRAAVGLSRDRLGRSHWQCHCDSCHLQTTEPTVATKPTVEPSVTRPIPIRLHWPPGSLTWTDSD
jgi:hypothetical protein